MNLFKNRRRRVEAEAPKVSRDALHFDQNAVVSSESATQIIVASDTNSIMLPLTDSQIRQILCATFLAQKKSFEIY